MSSLFDRILRIGLRTAEGVVRDRLRDRNRSPREAQRTDQRGKPGGTRGGNRGASGRQQPTPGADSNYPGDLDRLPSLQYAPHPDGVADPGEIAWTWVPFEEDHAQGKDRPVLIVGRDGDWLVAVQLTSKDHDRDAEQEARAGRYWIDIGSGDWDRQGRPSEVRVNRLIRVRPADIRTEGTRVDEGVFTRVADAIRKHY